ncbi:MAG: outer membrane lipid asymmetry maintenance protein MlaD [Xanthomonadales bacterium]|nr:outer membrane lipid asymmetry maintenance protein MlaD [Xanthomonadales bacterium]NIN60028.1 outer membrane lipid asymmetry maintenance protein MlaD [Xanthomonadales bacterium]NIN75396.1 outer membrane lipid asymmetry maintenance protein MlaD [Xanthomonadales bacterium]NIO14219.1 outer membrane lipid asymmetry maintenance protein MlaD [Xanthomonadales bacterium]NIP12421.1 outer membrane lipid asymmetry maintenance protein MlaD [Xanthomonadales bacterium]
MRANYKVELASGIFLLLGIFALIWLATRATDYGKELGDEAYYVSARFTNVADLKDRAPVKIGGVTVGEIESITLDPLSFEAVVTMRLDQRFDEIPIDSSASVLTSGVLGDRYIGLEPGGDLEVLQDGDELFVTQSAVVLEQLVSKYLFNTRSEPEAEDEP